MTNIDNKMNVSDSEPVKNVNRNDKKEKEVKDITEVKNVNVDNVNNLKNNKSTNFKLTTGTKFCTYKKKSSGKFPLVLEQELTFNSCNGLKVKFMGHNFSINEYTDSEYKFNFDKGTIYSLESDEIGLIQSLNHPQEFCVGTGTKIEVPAGTMLLSVDREQDISITLNHRMVLEII